MPCTSCSFLFTFRRTHTLNNMLGVCKVPTFNYLSTVSYDISFMSTLLTTMAPVSYDNGAICRRANILVLPLRIPRLGALTTVPTHHDAYTNL
jgi:hypothetical protein